MSQAGLKAGLIGGAIVALLQLVGLIPFGCLGCFIWIPSWATYVGVGALAAYWLPIPRSVGDGAGTGAIAGIVTGIIGGIFSMIVSGINFAITGGSAAILSQIPQESLDALRDAGLDPATFTGFGAVLGISAFCCVVSMVIAVALGAIGGAIFAAAKSD
jgi:hypothetical protein